MDSSLFHLFFLLLEDSNGKAGPFLIVWRVRESRENGRRDGCPGPGVQGFRRRWRGLRGLHSRPPYEFPQAVVSFSRSFFWCWRVSELFYIPSFVTSRLHLVCRAILDRKSEHSPFLVHLSFI